MNKYEATIDCEGQTFKVSLKAQDIESVTDTLGGLIAHGHTISGMCHGVSTDNCGDLLDNMEGGSPEYLKAEAVLNRIHDVTITFLGTEEELDEEDGDLELIAVRKL